ncbi:MAG: Mur ligase domain-containing protein, partial [Bacteroidales bacterium]|nr:Mur ligase domain-containing protein [Bacteroidales bacterium]
MIEELYSKYVGTGYRVTTDSRAISGGEMFFALRGENFDGNDYALKAIEAGAAWAVVNGDAGLPENPKLIKVADPFRELQELAVYHRLHVLGDKRLPVIGLTGTNGKTTTKELIREVLAAKYRVTATEGNLNNDIGVPLSILKITPETEIAVIEMGANHPDDIAKLVKVSQPDYGLITNVGKAHLLGFGSFEGVKAAKGELYKWLGSHRGSVIFLNE